ncbi:MAG: hypothetical protein COB46_00655 [Rhodospirillaceae bacterium]|nr:MAG: hypothetical protein COB46_00655 [Rhodospirillaceae bacterium]
MSKKKAAGAPLWIVTFADLMSLLLTFFILLLSFSNMEVQEFKKVAGAMRSAFGLQTQDRLAGLIELDGFTESKAVKHVVQIPLPEQDITDMVIPDQEDTLDEGEDVPQGPPAPPPPSAEEIASKKLFGDLKDIMTDEMKSGALELFQEGNSIVVRFPAEHSFASGQNGLLPDILPVLTKVLDELETSGGQIIIAGHTDNIPITTDQYRSNWDLSASRAASVAHYILDYTGIPANRITVQGFADSRPLTNNDTVENRAKNRRIELIIDKFTKTIPTNP